ncbi:hypothetical protein SLW70_08705 [Flavobacterium sp. NG2]|nr:hypothetical protein [Flavobacterium sp. NG2]WPR73186.1 hypothetical protein SLW70_08705 [Flavobacterium sp. NG2]
MKKRSLVFLLKLNTYYFWSNSMSTNGAKKIDRPEIWPEINWKDEK